MSKKWIAVSALYLGLLAVCIVALYAIPSVKGMLERTYIAEFGTLDVKDDVSAFVVRDEHVFVADTSCSLSRVAGEGELVKANAAVVSMTPKEGSESTAESGSYDEIVKALGNNVISCKDGSTTLPGYVSYNADGSESELSISRMGELTRADYEAYSQRKSRQTPKRSCKKGEPVFKIVTNGKWYLVIYTSRDSGSKYREGSYAYIDANGKPVRVRIHKVDEIEEGARVILECKSFVDGYLDARTISTTVTLASAEGLILQKTSLAEHEGRQGVFVKNKIGEHVFKPVMIIAEDGDRCVVYSDIYLDAEGIFVETIGTYDEVIAEPTEEDIASLNRDREEKKEDNNEENSDVNQG